MQGDLGGSYIELSFVARMLTYITILGTTRKKQENVGEKTSLDKAYTSSRNTLFQETSTSYLVLLLYYLQDFL